ncbi:MAG TPA: serine hydrolase domain-containing protein [Acidobacteriota bacterium]|nr:serine hydrolase domain-containing protein [Acidobacteriota bacterium]
MKSISIQTLNLQVNQRHNPGWLLSVKLWCVLLTLVILFTSMAFPVLAEPQANKCDLPQSRPEAEGLDRATLDAVLKQVRAAGTDAFVILRNGNVVVEEYNGRPERILAQSVTKSITSLAVGTAIDHKFIKGPDQLASDFFPEWRNTEKGSITLRHLLTHTSGIAAGKGSVELYGAKDALAYARNQPLAEPVGSVHRYNNVGIMLLSGVVEIATGLSLEKWARKTLFDPLCITDIEWRHDQRGHTLGQGDLQIRALDLAKIGQLVLNRGQWNGQQVISQEWIAQSTRMDAESNTPLALAYYAFCWRSFTNSDTIHLDDAFVKRLKAANVEASLVAWVAQRATGERKTMDFRAELDTLYGEGKGIATWFSKTGGGLEPPRTKGPAEIIYHDGDGGQYVIVIPARQLVVVRMRRMGRNGYAGGAERDLNNMIELAAMLSRTSQVKPASPSEKQ